jgi:8-oxo-dGTP diphosphatase
MKDNSDEKIKIGAGLLIIRDGKILMTKRKSALGNGEYGTVGGHVEFGEHPTEAAIREAKEELGIEIGNLNFLDCASIIKYGKHYIDISFTAEIISGKPKVMEPDKFESVDWYSLDNLPGPIFEPIKAVIGAYKTKQTYFEIRQNN